MICKCCRTAVSPATGLRPRAMIFDFLYATIFECPTCLSTQAAVLWELDDEMLTADALSTEPSDGWAALEQGAA